LERLKISAGIGIEWTGYFLAQTEGNGVENENNLVAEIMKKRRKILPFFSVGLFYNLKNNFYLQLFVRQMMLGYFTEKTKIYFNSQATEPMLILNDRPTVAGIGISYFFD
jgi:outer membrane protein W